MNKTSLAQIMIFYAILSYGVSPGIGYYLTEDKNGITYGMLLGIIISIILWYQYGQKLVDLE